jgi:hypothetical protein
MNLDDDLTEEELEKLARVGTDEQRRAVAMHPSASLQTLDYLSCENFHDEVYQNPLLLFHIEGASIDVIRMLERIAKKTNSSERLEELSCSIWVEVRVSVAWNENTTQLTLARLAKDKHRYVRYGVAQNPNTSIADLYLLSKDKLESVRCTLSRNVNTPLSILTLLAKCDNPEVRNDARATLRKIQKVPQ